MTPCGMLVRTPFPTIPESNSLSTFRWIGQSGELLMSSRCNIPKDLFVCPTYLTDYPAQLHHNLVGIWTLICVLTLFLSLSLSLSPRFDPDGSHPSQQEQTVEKPGRGDHCQCGTVSARKTCHSHARRHQMAGKWSTVGLDNTLHCNTHTASQCSEIGSLTSLDAPESTYMNPVTSENQLHCTGLYLQWKSVQIFGTWKIASYEESKWLGAK